MSYEETGKICIVTIVKDEQLYLDEWIKYHLDMGVDHIFIVEDYDSKSHESITSKYDNVTLMSVKDILTDDELEYAFKAKVTKEDNPQHLYFKKAISNVKRMRKYDWCFQIDVDEFIELNEKDVGLNATIVSVMRQFNEYDAVLLQWKCYGATCNVFMPDYSKTTVRETFLKPSPKGVLHCRKPDHWSKRAIFNLHRYEESFYYTVHQPSKECCLCNTRFDKDRTSWCYDKIFLRHYITKSLEEYVWKKSVRGYFNGASRTLEHFFMMNPEMMSQRHFWESIIEHADVIMKYDDSDVDLVGSMLACWEKFCISKCKLTICANVDDETKINYAQIRFVELNKFDDIMQKCKNAFMMPIDMYPMKKFTIFDVMRLQAGMQDVHQVFEHVDLNNGESMLEVGIKMLVSIMKGE